MFDIFFVGVSFSGITFSALVRLFGMNELKPLTRPAELITIISLILAALCVLADQGRVFYALLNLPRYARPMSPMFGTFTLVISGYLSASLIYFYLSSRKDAFELSKYFENSKLKRLFYKLWTAGWKGDLSQEKRHETSSFWPCYIHFTFACYCTFNSWVHIRNSSWASWLVFRFASSGICYYGWDFWNRINNSGSLHFEKNL
jgi:Ni/Fe-hydrogenase subunit HybB-like protein